MYTCRYEERATKNMISGAEEWELELSRFFAYLIFKFVPVIIVILLIFRISARQFRVN